MWAAALAVVAGVLTWLLPRPGHAIPVFARKYGTACTTCHVGGPKKLNAFGEVFRLNGYQMPRKAEKQLRSAPELPLGAAARKQLFPDTVWPGELPATVPVAFYVQQRLRVDLSRSEGELELESPHELEAVLGGTLGSGIGFFGEVHLWEHGELGGLGRLNIVFSDPVGSLLPPGWLSVRAGRLEPAAEPYSDTLRRSIRHNVVSSYSVADDGFALRGLQGGLELFGRPTGRLLWHAGVVNGESPDTEISDDKDFYGGIEVKLGGLPYYIERPPTANVKPWRDDSITVGVSGYAGRHLIEPLDPMDASFRNRFWRLTGKLRGHVGDLDIQTAIAVGRDHNPDGSGQAVDSLAWTAQAEYVVYPWLQALLLYDELRIEELDTRRAVTSSLAVFARMNVVFRFEATFELGAGAADPLAQVDLLYAF